MYWSYRRGRDHPPEEYRAPGVSLGLGSPTAIFTLFTAYNAREKRGAADGPEPRSKAHDVADCGDFRVWPIIPLPRQG